MSDLADQNVYGPAVAEAPVVTEPGVYGLTMEEYLADPVPGGSLSSSGAKKLLPPSCPAKYKWERDHGEQATAAMERGSAVHQLLLGGGHEVVPVDADSWRTKAARDARDEARARGAIPMLRDAYEEAQAMVAALRAHPYAPRLFDPEFGDAEQSLFWCDDDTGVMRRCRLDFFPRPGTGRRLVVADYKTAASAHPDKFSRSAADYGYNQQAAWNLDGLRALGYGDAAFVFVVQEVTPPYLVTVCQLDALALQIGARKNRAALEVYARCAAEDRWPGYSDDRIAVVPMPRWYERENEEN